MRARHLVTQPHKAGLALAVIERILQPLHHDVHAQLRSTQPMSLFPTNRLCILAVQYLLQECFFQPCSSTHLPNTSKPTFLSLAMAEVTRDLGASTGRLPSTCRPL